MDNWSTVPKPTSREVELMLHLLQTWFQSAEAEEQLIESLKSKPNNATGREMEVSGVWNASSNDIWGTGMFVCISVVVSCNFFTFFPFQEWQEKHEFLEYEVSAGVRRVPRREKVTLWRKFCYGEQNWFKYWRILLGGTQSILLN